MSYDSPGDSYVMDWSKLVYYIQPATLGSALVGLVWWIMKKALARAAEELKGVKDQLSDSAKKLDSIETITKVQAENHLCTIQAESIKQTALLTDMAKELAETNGSIKTLVTILSK
jgi:hypothetical protein